MAKVMELPLLQEVHSVVLFHKRIFSKTSPRYGTKLFHLTAEHSVFYKLT